MSYELQKQYTEKQRSDFIIRIYNVQDVDTTANWIVCGYIEV